MSACCEGPTATLLEDASAVTRTRAISHNLVGNLLLSELTVTESEQFRMFGTGVVTEKFASFRSSFGA
jgi:hypothetical protein